jgi:TPR repeat protein
LGHLYEIGDGVPEDFTEAAKWYRKAAEQGNAEAQLYLGCSYLIGRGVPKDSAEHLNWTRKAAQQGFADAQVQLGHLYEIGQGVPKDFSEAYMWINLAAASGNKEYGELRELLGKRMTREQLVEGQKLTGEWLERKAKETGK